MIKKFLKRYALLHSWVLALVIWFAAYAAVIHSRTAANAVTAVTQKIKDGFAAVWYIFPFSVVEWLYVAFILLVLVWLTVLVIRLRRCGARLHVAYRGLLSLVCLCLSVWGFYCTMWGINYYADGFQEKSGIYAQPVTVDELERVTRYFVQQLRVYADQVERNENGIFSESRDSIFLYSTEIYDNAAKEFPFLAREDRVPKKMVFSRLFSAMNFTGFYTPFTGESNLNVDSPACLLPANISHELAHQRGIASEQECNFLAILAATTCDNEVYRYSGYLMGYIHLGNALYRADRERWEQVYALLPEMVRADLRYQSAYWEQFEGTTAAVSRKIYDSTLKSYGQEDGIQSYGTVVDLLVAYY